MKKAQLDPYDLDIVAITLRPQPDETYLIAGVSDENDKEFKDKVRVGDKLIKVDSLEVNGVSLARVVDSLRGKVCRKHALVLERAGKQFEVKASIIRLL